MKEKDFLRNNRLFSDYYLKELLPKDLIWDIDVSEDFRKIKEIYERKKDTVTVLNEPSLEDQFIRPILRVLGHKWEVNPSLKNYKKPDYSFYENEEEKVKAELSKDYFGNAIAVGEVKRWERPLDKKLKDESDPFEVYSPSLQMERYLWFTEVKWGILTNGRLWRIYERGTSNKLDIYYEVDLINILENYDLEAFKYFQLFFRKEAFPDFLDKVYEESIDYAKAVGEDLKSNVYKAIRILANGFLETSGNNLSIDNLQEIYDNSLIFLYRLLFILYAESRGLLPLQKSIYRESYSIYSIKKVIAKKKDRNESIPILQKSYWGKITVLFELINSGSESFGISEDDFFVPPYNGGLFNQDKNTFLEKNEISDYFIANVIDLLSRSTIKNEVGKAFVDYSSLDIRHLGSIYEGLLENKLKVAQENMSTIKSGKTEIWIESKDLGSKKAIDNVLKGKLYPVTDKGERRTTGSYYTPDYIVKYIVENTIGPLIKEKRSKLEREEDLIDEILSLKILDPAMGSGHFLVEATDFIARSLVEALGASLKEIEEEDIRWARREVVEKCIYGVDLNPLAVELAKLSLWLSTVSKDKPLSFLDHHLKCGNSLIGVRIEDLAELPDIKSKKMKKMIGQISTYEILFNKKIEVLLNNRKFIEELPSEKVEHIREKEKYEKEFRKKIERFKQIADLWTSIYFGNEISWENYITVQDKLESSEEEWQKIINEEWFERGLNIYKDKRFFHWELEFPEIFYMGERKKENPGFDSVIGNPPYVKEYVNKEAFGGLRNSPYYKGKMDIWYFFACEGIDLLKENGFLGYIAQNNWITNYGASIMRNKVMQETKILNLIDFGDYKIFDTAGIQTMIMVFKKENEVDNYIFDYRKLKHSKSAALQDALDILSTKKNKKIEYLTPRINREKYIDKPITFGNEKVEEILDKILEEGNFQLNAKEATNGIHHHHGIVNKNRKKILGDKYEVGQGIFVLSDKEKKSIPFTEKELELIKPEYTTKELFRYYANPKNKHWIIYTDSSFKDLNKINQHPNIKKHLDQFKEVITSDNKPYGLHRARDEKFFKGEKIISVRKCSEPTFTYTDFDCYVSATFYVIKTERINMKYLTTLLNSKLISFWLKHKGKMQGNNYQIDKEPLLNIPIKKPSEENQKSFIKLADKMLSLNKQLKEVKEDLQEKVKIEKEIKETDKKINKLVDKLYGLTEGEIKIVEES